MNSRIKKSGRLAEIIALVVIIGFIAVIAAPSYSQYQKRVRRADANTALLAIQAAHEQYRLMHQRYATSIEGLTKSARKAPYFQ